MRAKRAAKDKKAALAQGEERVDIEKKLQSVGIEPTLLRTRALSVRLNRSAKSAYMTAIQKNDFLAQWQRVGFQTRRLGVRFPQRSFTFLLVLRT